MPWKSKRQALGGRSEGGIEGESGGPGGGREGGMVEEGSAGASRSSGRGLGECEYEAMVCGKIRPGETLEDGYVRSEKGNTQRKQIFKAFLYSAPQAISPILYLPNSPHSLRSSLSTCI